MPPNDIAFLISVEQRLEKDEKWWNKFAGWDDQQALVSCLPGRGVGGRWSRSICTEYNPRTKQFNAVNRNAVKCPTICAFSHRKSWQCTCATLGSSAVLAKVRQSPEKLQYCAGSALVCFALSACLRI